MLDVPSLCRLHIAFSSYSYADEIAEFLEECEVEVTAETLVTGDTTKIDFKTLAKLPPCNIVCNCLGPYLDLTLWFLKRIPCTLLKFLIDPRQQHDSYWPHPDFRFLGSTMVELTLENCIVDPEKLPINLTKLTLSDCEEEALPLDLREFTRLTYLEGDNGVILPPLMTTLRYCWWIDPTELPNLNKVSGNQFDVLPWSQLESIEGNNFPSDQRMDQLREIQCYDFSIINHNLPKLDSVKLEGCRLSILFDYINASQLAQLTTLKAMELVVDDMDLLPNLKVLHCTITESLTKDYYLPPHLVELVSVSEFPATGVPPQLEDCVCEAKSGKLVVESKKLKRLKIIVKEVTINCPNLVELSIQCDDIEYISAPRLARLKHISPKPFPFGDFPMLIEVELERSAPFSDLSSELGWYPQNVVLKQHLKSFKISNVSFQELSISADYVRLCNCILRAGAKIMARKLEVYRAALVVGDKDIRCQELDCNEIDHVPSMVEVVSLVLGRPKKRTFTGRFIIPELRHCRRLKSLTINHGLENYQGKIPIPPSVKQLSVCESMFRECIKFDTPSRLEHVWCISEDMKEYVEFSQTPVSVVYGEDLLDGTRTFEPRFLE